MVRVVERNGAPWFVAADVCRALGISDVSMAVAKLDADEKGTSSIGTLGGRQEMVIISEGGFYTLVLRSRDATKPGSLAHRFRKWVTDEVLPTIRRSGQYQAPPAMIDEEVQTPDNLKVRKVNTAMKCFGERAGAQLWVKLGLEWVPAMAGVLSQPDLLDSVDPPGTVTVKVTPTGSGAH